MENQSSNGNQDSYMDLGILLFSNKLIEITRSYYEEDDTREKQVSKFQKLLIDKDRDENCLMNKWVQFLDYLLQAERDEEFKSEMYKLKGILIAKHYPPTILIFQMIKSLLTAFIDKEAQKLFFSTQEQERKWKEKEYITVKMNAIDRIINLLKNEKKQSPTELSNTILILEEKLEESSKENRCLQEEYNKIVDLNNDLNSRLAKNNTEPADEMTFVRNEIKNLTLAMDRREKEAEIFKKELMENLKKELLEREKEAEIFKKELLEREKEAEIFKKELLEREKEAQIFKKEITLMKEQLSLLERSQVQCLSLHYLKNLRKRMKVRAGYEGTIDFEYATKAFHDELLKKGFNFHAFYHRLSDAIEFLSNKISSSNVDQSAIMASVASVIDMDDVEKMESFL